MTTVSGQSFLLILARKPAHLRATASVVKEALPDDYTPALQGSYDKLSGTGYVPQKGDHGIIHAAVGWEGKTEMERLVEVDPAGFETAFVGKQLWGYQSAASAPASPMALR